MIEYNKTKWVDGNTPIDAEKLNNIETGIEQISNLGIISKSVVGIEVTETIPEEPIDKYLYFILGNDGQLKNIMYGSVIIS